MTTLRPALPSGRRPYLPAAPYYDGQARDTVLDEYGSTRGVHPTDSGMAMSLMVKKGSCKSAMDMGNELHLISDLSAPDLAEQVRAKVLVAEPLARLVAAKKSVIESIQHEARRGALAVVVNYTNTETGERGKRAEWYT